MAVALLVCAALLANSLLLIERSSFGFDRDHLVTFRLSVGAEYANRAGTTARPRSRSSASQRTCARTVRRTSAA
jgi:hypothetical protein